MKKYRWIIWILVLITMLYACSQKVPADRIDKSVLAAWEGGYSIENRKNTISEYKKKYIPIYVVNLSSQEVCFNIDFEGTSCGGVLLAPVDDNVKNAELNTIVDFTTDVRVDDKTVIVDTSWWFDSEASVKNYPIWSYLFWVKDAQGTQHYYYFRVNYTT